MSFKFLTFLFYSPRGKSEIEILEERLLVPVKQRCKLQYEIKPENKRSRSIGIFFKLSFNSRFKKYTFSRLSCFPAKIVCETFDSSGMGEIVADCLMCKYAIPKSSGQFHADTRNKV
ncbi:hypothetical protein PQ459_13575 [Chryseobacterium sp. KACC 21268]|nr:hypothetical protein PQ459_13575 [Chryseobacterium sp. KACC 21268]